MQLESTTATSGKAISEMAFSGLFSRWDILVSSRDGENKVANQKGSYRKETDIERWRFG